MEEERRFFEEAVRVSSGRQARAEAIRVERERYVEAEQRTTEEEAVRMEAGRRSAAMKRPLEFSFVLCPINFSPEFSFILCEIEFSLEFSFRLTFQILDWLQIAFGFISDW